MANESACQSAVTVAGSPYTYSGSIKVDYLPKGCVWSKAGGGFYFNTVTSGAPRPFFQPVCAGAQSLAATPVLSPVGLVYVVPTHGCLLDSRVSVRLPAVLPCTDIVTRLLARTCCAGPATAVPTLTPPKPFELGSGADCPQGLFRITTVAGCASAATVSASPYRGSLDSPYMPKGCYWLTIGGSFYYNTNAGFGKNLVAQPVCAGAPGLYSVLTSIHPSVQCGRFNRALARSSGCKRGGETCLCRVRLVSVVLA